MMQPLVTCIMGNVGIKVLAKDNGMNMEQNG